MGEGPLALGLISAHDCSTHRAEVRLIHRRPGDSLPIPVHVRRVLAELMEIRYRQRRLYLDIITAIDHIDVAGDEFSKVGQGLA